jgi:hypothetical protein
MGNDQKKNEHGGDENTRPSVGKDQPQDLENHPPAAPGSHRPASNPPPTYKPNPDRG